MAHVFTCELCKGEFTSERPDEEALAESTSAFGEFPQEELSEICDDCWNKFMKWWKK